MNDKDEFAPRLGRIRSRSTSSVGASTGGRLLRARADFIGEDGEARGGLMAAGSVGVLVLAECWHQKSRRCISRPQRPSPDTDDTLG